MKTHTVLTHNKHTHDRHFSIISTPFLPLRNCAYLLRRIHENVLIMSGNSIQKLGLKSKHLYRVFNFDVVMTLTKSKQSL